MGHDVDLYDRHYGPLAADPQVEAQRRAEREGAWRGRFALRSAAGQNGAADAHFWRVAVVTLAFVLLTALT